MTLYKPLVLIGAEIKELPDGDSINGFTGGQIYIDLEDEGNSISVSNSTLIFQGGGFNLSNAGSGQLDIKAESGGSSNFFPTLPIISSLKDITVTSTNSQNYSITSDSNDKMSLKFDQMESSFLDITLPAGSLTAQQVCDAINNVANNNSLYSDEYEYAVVENNKVKLRSIRHCLNPEIVINAVTNNAYTTLGFSTGTYSATDQSKILISPYKILLPDSTIQKITTDTTLDITTASDLEYQDQTASAGQTVFTFSKMKLVSNKHLIYVNGVLKTQGTDYTLDSETQITFSSGLSAGDVVKARIKIVSGEWYYVYLTDESNWSKKAFISNQKPDAFGEHPKSYNAFFASSFFTKTATTIRPFIKEKNLVKTEKTTIYNAVTSTSWTALSVSNYVPPTTRIGRFIGKSNSTSTRCKLGSGLFSTQSGANSTYSINYKVMDYFVNSSHQVYIAYNGTSAAVQIISCGYIEDTFNIYT